MKHLVCSVRDRASVTFGPLLCFINRGSAIRAFSDAVNTEGKGNLQEHPEDFDLYELGEFDDNSGGMVLLKVPEQIAIGKDLKR